MLSRVHSDEISREILNFQDMDDITDSSEWKRKFSIFIQIWILHLNFRFKVARTMPLMMSFFPYAKVNCFTEFIRLEKASSCVVLEKMEGAHKYTIFWQWLTISYQFYSLVNLSLRGQIE